MTALARIKAGARTEGETVAEIADAEAVGAAAGAAAEAVVRKADPAGAICHLRNTHRHKAANLGDTRAAEERREATTIAARKATTALVLPRAKRPTSPSSCPENRSQNIAASPKRRLLRPRHLSNTRLNPSSRKLKKALLARRATYRPQAQAAAVFQGASLAGCPAGSWPMRVRRLKAQLQAPAKKQPQPKLQPLNR